MGKELAPPYRYLVRAEAATAVEALDALAKSYADRGIDLRKKALDPVQGAHANLEVAREIARITGPYHHLAGTSTLIEDLFLGPSISIVSLESGEGQVVLRTFRDVRELTHQRIESILERAGNMPKRAILITRLSRQSPAEILNRERKDVSKSLRTKRPWILFPFT